MKVRVLPWAIVLLAHGLVLAWLADSYQAPEPPQALPVLAVDMVSAENQATEPAAPPAEPPARPEPLLPAAAPAAPRPEPKSPPAPKSDLAPKKPPRQTKKQEPKASVTQPADQAPVSGTPPAAPAPTANGTPDSAPTSPTAQAAPQAGASATQAPTTSIYIPAEYAASNRKPVYPTLSRRYSEEGTVVLRVLVNADGRAGQVEIHTSSGHKLLDQSAQQAVQGWRFAPATRNGQPVSDWFLVPIPFKLHD